MDNRVWGSDFKKPTVKQAINAKMKVLREFGVVNKENARDIKRRLQREVDAHPNRDYEVVLDQVAQPMIMEYLDNERGN